MGWSAFVGFLVLIITWPLNNFMAKRAVRIQKGVSSARDKRMGVLNELITAVSGAVQRGRVECSQSLTYAASQIHQVLCMGG